MRRTFTGWVFTEDFNDLERPFTEVYSDHNFLNMTKVKVTVDDGKTQADTTRAKKKGR